MNLPKKTCQKEVLAVIPARGGSKGIPRKNIVDLCGKPLIAYTIEVAIQSRFITRVIVSTDDEEIATISQSYGAEIPFMRPKKLAHDQAIVSDAFQYTLDRLCSGGYKPDALVSLYPTHVFRSTCLVDFLINKMLSGYQIVKTVKCAEFSSGKIVDLGRDHFLHTLTYSQGENYCRSYGTFMGQMLSGHQPRGLYLHYLDDPVSLIDIDDTRDLELAKMVIMQGLFDFQLS